MLRSPSLNTSPVSVFQKQPLEVFYNKSVVRNFAKFTWKHLSPSLLFNKVAGLRPTVLFKKRFWHRCFPVNFAKFLRTPFLKNTSQRLLLIFHRLSDEFGLIVYVPILDKLTSLFPIRNWILISTFEFLTKSFLRKIFCSQVLISSSCFSKYVLLKNLQISQEINCFRVSF